MNGTYFKACQLCRLRATRAMRIKGTRKFKEVKLYEKKLGFYK